LVTGLVRFSEHSSKHNPNQTTIPYVAQIALSMGDAEQAIKRLKMIRPGLLSAQDKINFYQSLAFANVLQGDVLQGVNARLKLSNLLRNPQQQQANISAIVDMLSVLPEETLQALAAAGHPVLHIEMPDEHGVAQFGRARLEVESAAGFPYASGPGLWKGVNDRVAQWKRWQQRTCRPQKRTSSSAIVPRTHTLR
jgi:hypothetical protein